MKIDNIKITVLLVLFLVFTAPAILSFGIRFVPEKEMSETGGSIKVYGDNKLTFNIDSQKDNLVGILIRVKNGMRSSSDLKLQIMDERNNMIGESSLNGLSILDGSIVRFSFPVLSNQVANGSWKGVFTSDADEENAMELYLEKDFPKLSFVALYKTSSHIVLIKNIYLEWFKRLFGIG